MEDRAEILRRRIDAYRCYLAVGSDIVITRLILREIATDEAELAAIADRERSNAGPQEDFAPVSARVRATRPRTRSKNRKSTTGEPL